ncbi:pachytene checkpoint protein 2 homolog isoform X3 [Amia ocellicauda]|uniref:pachytene checkpoint protein 2 homolog isoform X3 n=1 Tax=Amia ocellicauda TaxID=2972642 RepID=UPI0034643DFC
MDATGDLGQTLSNGLKTLNIHVEVHVKSSSTAKKDDVKLHVLELLNRHRMVFGEYKWTEFDDEFLVQHVECVAVVDADVIQPVDLKSCCLSIHIFTLNEEAPSTENLEEDEDLAAANHWLLPAAEFHGIWESLIYDNGVKSQLLDYVSTTIFFSDKKVDSNLIAWNRVVLLHGPPGTGKTSLCKALAQKLSIRLSNRYRYGQFVEINSHSLFSKWFSEVESLTAARNASQAGTEPSDAIRVVNSVLTQLDQIKRYPNVVILTTSNVTEKIDLAFVDRADIKQYIGLPSPDAIFNIYLSCLEELMKCQIIYPKQQLLTLRELQMLGFLENNISELSLSLKRIAVKSKGLSGRGLRKLPFLAHALYVKTPTVTLERFLQALAQAVDKQFEEKANLTNSV